MDGYIPMCVIIGKGQGCGTVNSECTLTSEGKWKLNKCGHEWNIKMEGTKTPCPKCTMTFTVFDNTYTVLKDIKWETWIENEEVRFQVNGEYIDDRLGLNSSL